MALVTRHHFFAGALFLLGACAHEPAKPPEREQIVAPTAPTSSETTVEPTDTTTGAPPSLTMPREWQHHNGEDYDDLFDRMRAGFALDEVQEPAIDTQLAWLEHNPDYLERVFQRGQRYMYHVVTEVEARGMPLEFALLPVVESAYEPFAYSSSRAAGLWQFIPDTGRRFGLKQNWWFDGRRDVIESTRAALDYLQALHDQFDGDWLLAIAAYNVGENTVARELEYNRAHGKPTDFWHLKLPLETRAYVPKLLALKRLMAEPERYGLEFAVIPNEPYFAVIDTSSQIDLKIAAQLARTSYDDLVSLNPGYNRWATDPEGPHRILVPIDNADGFETALGTLSSDDRVRFTVHEVTRRETLAMIAKQYGTSVAVISKVNDLKDGKVAAGDSLKNYRTRFCSRQPEWTGRISAGAGSVNSCTGSARARLCRALPAAMACRWALLRGSTIWGLRNRWLRDSGWSSRRARGDSAMKEQGRAAACFTLYGSAIPSTAFRGSFRSRFPSSRAGTA
jgi:membrane-bound lytic murein transglycosylase D